MALGGGGSEVGEDGVVHAHGGRYNGLCEGFAFGREPFQEVSEDRPEDKRHTVVLHCRVSGETNAWRARENAQDQRQLLLTLFVGVAALNASPTLLRQRTVVESVDTSPAAFL